MENITAENIGVNVNNDTKDEYLIEIPYKDSSIKLPGVVWKIFMEAIAFVNPIYPELLKSAIYMDTEECNELQQPENFPMPRTTAMMNLLGWKKTS